jgi:dihydrofolate synthase/folylpolyglutamate synthase
VLKNDFNFIFSKFEIVEGLETAKHNGRLEFYKNILFDGAHNVAGAKALRNYLDEFIKQPVTLVFGAMRDKDLSEIAAILFPKAETLILTMETSELLKIVPTTFNQKDVKLAETVAEAIITAKVITKETELILITGSLYLVGEAQEILKSAF